MPERDEFVRQLREARAYFEDGATGVINIPKVPDVPDGEDRTHRSGAPHIALHGHHKNGDLDSA